MNIDDYITRKEVQHVCQELGIRDWTKLTETKVQIEEARIIQVSVGSEAQQIPVEWFQQGLEVELEHGFSMLLNLRETYLKHPRKETLKNYPGYTRN